MPSLPFDFRPNRIICLTDETVETLYLLGEEKRIVGISGFTKRPPQARKEKPKVSAFVDANLDEIIKLNPDLVIGFSDIQSKIAQQLIEKGITVWVNNYRSVNGILKMIGQLGALVGKENKANELIGNILSKIDEIKSEIENWKIKPKVYFEEWDEPIITGIQWVSEIIELAGGEDIFSENKKLSLGKDRIIENSNEVVKRKPDIILDSWCGKKFKKEKMLVRKNWSEINAIKNENIIEIKSEIILQPGPAALMEGLHEVHEIFKKWKFSI